MGTIQHTMMLIPHMQLDRASRALTTKTRSILNQMLLYDIKVVTYALSGKVKYELAQLVGS
jgi:hypothetical protein